MFIIISGYPSGGIKCYGPFKTEQRAKEYQVALERDIPEAFNHIQPLIQPYHK